MDTPAGAVAPGSAEHAADLAIVVRGLGKRFPPTKKGEEPKVALDSSSMSFAVKRGEIFGLIGPNGTGKSSLIRAMLDLLEPDEGTLEILGSPPSRVRSKIRRVAAIPELDGRLNVAQNIALVAGMYSLDGNVAAERCRLLFEKLSFADELWTRKLDTFSRGQLQMVSLVLAFMTTPEVLLLDEPTSGMDVTTRRVVRDLVVEYCREYGATVLWATHDLEEMALCHRIAFLKQGGKVSTIGTPAELVAAAGSGAVTLEDAYERFTKESLRTETGTTAVAGSVFDRFPEEAVPAVGLGGRFRRFFTPGWAIFRRQTARTAYNWAWELVMLFAAIFTGFAIVQIGLDAGNPVRTLNIMLGCLVWTYLGSLIMHVGFSMTFEQWEGTIEKTFSSPMARSVHLAALGVFAAMMALTRGSVVFCVLWLFTGVSIEGANVGGVFLVTFLGGFSFLGIGLLAAVLPLRNKEYGSQVVTAIQATLLVVSGVYSSIDSLPYWLQPLAYASPATWVLEANRKLMGIGIEGSVAGALHGQPLAAVSTEITVLVCFVLLLPLGFWVFKRSERRAKALGLLKRNG